MICVADVVQDNGNYADQGYNGDVDWIERSSRECGCQGRIGDKYVGNENQDAENRHQWNVIYLSLDDSRCCLKQVLLQVWEYCCRETDNRVDDRMRTAP